MNEDLILEVIRSMQGEIPDEKLQELQMNMRCILEEYNVTRKEKELSMIDTGWELNLQVYLLSKNLEGKTQSTIKRYEYELKRLLCYINKPVMKIGAGDVSRYLRCYKAIRRVSNQTLKNVRACFSSFFGWLRDHGRIKENPMMLVENVKVEQRIKKPFDDEERELLLRNCKCLRDKALMEFLYSTAIRVSELVRLNVEDVRFGEKDLIVYGKGQKERIVYINDKANLYLREYLECRKDTNRALFVSENHPHKRLGKAGVEHLIRRTGLRAGVEKAHPHRFRRTAATNALNRGMPLQEVSKMLGHKKLETTMEYCTVEQESVKYHHKKYLSA